MVVVMWLVVEFGRRVEEEAAAHKKQHGWVSFVRGWPLFFLQRLY